VKLRRRGDRLVLSVRLSRANALSGGLLSWGGAVVASGRLSAVFLAGAFLGAWYSLPRS
jgi:hypothetical protein